MPSQHRWFTLESCSYRDVDKGSCIERIYFIGDRQVSEKKYKLHQAKLDDAKADWEAYKETLPDLQPSQVIDRDGRWALENGGRGHRITLGERDEYFQSKGELDAVAASRGMRTSSDWSNLYDTSSHKQAQKVETPKFDPDKL